MYSIDFSSNGDIVVGSAAGVTTYSFTGFTGCEVVYNESTADGVAPVVVPDDTGC